MNIEQDTPDNDLKNTLLKPSLRKRSRHRWLNWRLFVTLIVIGLISTGGIYQYQQNTLLHQAIEQQKIALTQAQHTDMRTDDETKMLQLTLASRIDEIEKTMQALSTLYQQSINNHELQRLLADTEQTLTMASEALYLTNDVSAALKLLTYASNKIQGLNQPELVKLHAALQQDIQTLSALSQVDVAAETARIDTLINIIDRLPLNIDTQRILTPKTPTVSADAQLSWWKQLGRNIWHELKSLVSIQRLDKPQQALISVDQVMLLRENMKLRMICARIALMTHNQAAYGADLHAVQKYLMDYFDQGQINTQQANDLLQKLLNVQLVIAKPIFTSLSVLRSTHIAPVLKEGEHG